jgi:cathepsin A (carboxypeptidase C)
MRIAASTVLFGAASAASFQQQAQHVLSGGFGKAQEAMKPISDAFTDAAGRPFESFEDAFSGMTAETKALWEEIKLLVPDSAFKDLSWLSKPKPHRRRDDWNHVVKGADVQGMWVQDADGEKHRQVDGRLEDYNLRVKAVDPSKLNVDSVKQYSGYLDDEANDKHLFYCKFPSVFFIIAAQIHSC